MKCLLFIFIVLWTPVLFCQTKESQNDQILETGIGAIKALEREILALKIKLIKAKHPRQIKAIEKDIASKEKALKAIKSQGKFYKERLTPFYIGLKLDATGFVYSKKDKPDYAMSNHIAGGWNFILGLKYSRHCAIETGFLFNYSELKTNESNMKKRHDSTGFDLTPISNFKNSVVIIGTYIGHSFFNINNRNSFECMLKLNLWYANYRIEEKLFRTQGSTNYSDVIYYEDFDKVLFFPSIDFRYLLKTNKYFIVTPHIEFGKLFYQPIRIVEHKYDMKKNDVKTEISLPESTFYIQIGFGLTLRKYRPSFIDSKKGSDERIKQSFEKYRM